MAALWLKKGLAEIRASGFARHAAQLGEVPRCLLFPYAGLPDHHHSSGSMLIRVNAGAFSAGEICIAHCRGGARSRAVPTLKQGTVR